MTSSLSRDLSLQTVEWVPRVLAHERATYEEAARQEGHPAFQITEQGTRGELVKAGDRQEYFPVYFAEPWERSKWAFGFDLAFAAFRTIPAATRQSPAGLTEFG